MSRSSAVFAALTGTLGDENTGRSIGLTGAKQLYNARQPARLTPAMSAWYMANVAGPRVAAIAEVNNAFRSDKTVDGGAASIYLEVERDKIRSTGVSAAVVETERFLHKNREVIDRFNQYRSEFNTLKSQIKDEPVRTKNWLYITVLLVLVLLEAFINFESFMRVPYITSPFLATGATMAVALGIAVAAHFHGIVASIFCGRRLGCRIRNVKVRTRWR